MKWDDRKVEIEEDFDFLDPFPDRADIRKKERAPKKGSEAETKQREVNDRKENGKTVKDEIELRIQKAEAAKKQLEEERKQKKLSIGIVLDCTYSFSTVYPAVYKVLKKFFNYLQQEKNSYKGFQLEYSLTLLHDEPEAFVFGNGFEPDYFTSSEERVLNVLERELEFYGGSDNGRENLNKALNRQLFVLNTQKDAADVEHCYKGLLFFTDSLPEKTEKQPNYAKEKLEYEGKEYRNYGLRFAEFYSYTGAYMPKVRMVDSSGNADCENGKNDTRYHDIGMLFEEDPNATVEYVEEMIRKIIYQASVR